MGGIHGKPKRIRNMREKARATTDRFVAGLERDALAQVAKLDAQESSERAAKATLDAAAAAGDVNAWRQAGVNYISALMDGDMPAIDVLRVAKVIEAQGALMESMAVKDDLAPAVAFIWHCVHDGGWRQHLADTACACDDSGARCDVAVSEGIAPGVVWCAGCKVPIGSLACQRCKMSITESREF